ncbi:MAG TPA: hypothetical protein VKR55_07650 [Bradyrhizobium sp.]|uniref:hypothetical protein n=1 Tax=Bradyrhizobium sp. TaxID=376 RepID=UPI002C3D1CF3|nr:hypothetical protein [Bradyrhizobium sp.]HLZ02014.1 hypothetical protein [Bradyrhizobium sp.]
MPFALALVLASVSLWIFTRHNDFPRDYHPDEPSKIAQLVHPAQERNFNHPLLMLEATNVVRMALGVHNDERAVLLIGRWTSATFAAIAVLALALAGYCFGGCRGLLLCGGMVALCPALAVYAHFFKEDTALLAGLGIAIAGASWLLSATRPQMQWLAAAVMGTGFAAATSGKYVGVAAALPCLAALLVAPRMEPRGLMRRFVAFAVPAAAVTLMVNFRAFQDLVMLTPAASQRVVGEFFHATTGHDGLALGVPNAFLLRVSVSELLPDAWAFVAVATLLLLVRPRALALSEMVGGVFLLTFALVLSWSAFPFPRYALPVTVLGYFVAGQMMNSALQRLERPIWFKSAAFAGCVVLIVAVQGAQVWRFNKQFADDSRQRLREWVASHVEEQAAILAEDFTVLEGAGDSWRYPTQNRIAARIIRVGSVADRAPTFEQLKMSGVDYVAVAEPKYERYFRPGVHSTSSEGANQVAQHRRFYEDLFARAELVWSSAPSPPSHAYLNPELRLYRLPDVTVVRRKPQEDATKTRPD